MPVNIHGGHVKHLR